MTTFSDFPSDPTLWINEVEMGHSLDEFKSSRSVSGKNFPNIEMLDAKIDSALKKIIQNSQFKKKVRLEEQKAQKEDWFFAFMMYDSFRLTGAHDTVLEYADLCSAALHDDKFYCLFQGFPPLISWKVWTNRGYVSLRNSKPYWNCTTWRFIRRYRFPTIKSRNPW